MENFPRRGCVWLQVPTERKLNEAIIEIEGMGADERLSKAQGLISEALNLVSSYIDSDMVNRIKI